jgi:hypothetical protein
MTPDTKAIVEKLTNEGLLLRNNGTNSIKSVKLELSKFNDTFKALSSSMQGITGTIQGQTKLEELRDEREAKIELLDDKERKDFEKAEKENIKSQQKLDSQKLAQDLQLAKERDKKDFKIFGKGGIFASTLSGAFNIIKKTLFFGVVGAIGYQVLAGAVEALAPMWFGKDVKMPDLFDGFSRAGTALSKITSGDWDGLVENVKAISSPVGMLAAGYVAAKTVPGALKSVGGAAVSGAAQYLTFKSMLKLVTPGAADLSEGMTRAKVTRGLLRGGIAGLVFTGLYAAIDPIMNFMRRDDNFTADDIKKTEIPIGMQVGGLAGAATIAALFIPGGAIAMAVGGVAAFIIGGALRVVDYYKDDDMLPNKLEKVHAAHKRSSNQLAELLDVREQAMQLGLDPSEIDKEIKNLKAKIAKDREKFKANFVESFAEDEASIAEAQAGIERLQGETPDEYRARKFRSNPKASANTSDSQLMKMMIGEVNDLRDIIDLNKNQLKESQMYGASLGFTNEQMGITGDYALGSGMTVAKRDAIIEERKANREASLKQQKIDAKNAEFQKYLKINDIDFEGSITDVALKTMREQNPLGGNGMGNSIYVTNRGGDVLTPITLSQGGNQSATTILQGFNQGVGLGYCPVPGLLGT